MAFSLDRAVAAAEGKALGPHPALMDRNTPLSTYSPGTPRENAVITKRQAARHAQAYGGDEAIDHVHDCIGLYADPVATSPYKLERLDGTPLVRSKDKLTPPDHEIGPAGLYDLLDKPNPFVLYDELMSLLVIDLLLVGDHYWFKWQVDESGRPLALYRLAPSHVKIKPGPYGPKSYEYQPPGARRKMVIQPDRIIHFRRPNPHDPYYGMGVIQGSGRAMDLELAVMDTMASYYENRADPSLIIQSERRVPRDVFTKLRAQLRARASGSSNAGELLLLEAGLKASSLSASAKDALFQELATMSRNRIFQKFRVSPMLFGLMEQGMGSNKVSDARREFDNYALRPFMSRLQTFLTQELTGLWGTRLIIDYKQMLPPEEAIKVGESVAKVPGVKIREVRKQYEQFGIPESTGNPKIDEELLNLPLGELGPDGQPLDPSVASGADQPLSSEPGRPPKPSNTHSLGNAGTKALDELGRALALKSLEEAIEGKAITNTAGENVTVGNRLQGEKRPSDTFAAARAADIDNTTTAIAVALREAAAELERGLLDAVEGKALKTSDIVSRIRKSDAWNVFKDRLTTILEEGARNAAVSGVMHTGLVPEDDVDYDSLVKAVVHRPDGVRSILATFKDRIANKMKDARAADAERADFEAAIRAAVSDWTTSQAVAIADSEATEAYNEGTLTVAEMSGVKDFFVVEEDDAPDEECQAARGQVWSLEKARANRKEHPRCRRAFIALTAETVA